MKKVHVLTETSPIRLQIAYSNFINKPGIRIMDMQFSTNRWQTMFEYCIAVFYEEG